MKNILILLLLIPNLLSAQIDGKIRAKDPQGRGLSKHNYKDADSVAVNVTLPTKITSLSTTTGTLTAGVSALSAIVGGSVDVLIASNTDSKTVTFANLSAIGIGISTTVASGTASVAAFAFPGHSFTHVSAKQAFCLLTTSAGVTDTSFVAFDSRTSDYLFRLKRKYLISEGLQFVFGYCDNSRNTFNAGSGLTWASSIADPNLITNVRATGGPIMYISGVASIYPSVNYAGANPAVWKGTNYKLYNTIPILQAITSGGGGTSTTLVQSTTVVQPNTQPFQFVLPPKLYWIANNPLWLYQGSSIYNYNIFQKRPVDLAPITAKNGAGTAVTPFSQYPDYVVITPTESVSLTFAIRDYSGMDSLMTSNPKAILSKTYALSVVTKPTSKTINTVVTADSYIDAQWGLGVYKYLTDFATADGNTIVFKGTRTSYGFLGEARSSWSESTFFRYVPTAFRTGVNTDPTSVSMSSPFMFSSDNTVGNAVFDFAQYLSSNSIGAVDQVVIFLGKNGGDGTYTNLMITSIKAALPSAKIIVSYVTPAPANRFNYDYALAQKSTDNQNLSYNSKFAGRESSGIYLCPTSISFNRLYHHIGTNVDPVQFNLDGLTQSFQNNNHHENPSGAKSISWSLYNLILFASTQ